MKKEENTFLKVVKNFDLFGAGIFFICCVFVVAKIILRLFKLPIYGDYEIVRFLLIFAASFPLANCAAQKAHPNLTLLLDKLSEKAQKIVNILTGVIALSGFTIIVMGLFRDALKKFRVGEISPNLNVPLYYIGIVIAIGFILLALFILFQIVKDINCYVRQSRAAGHQEHKV